MEEIYRYIKSCGVFYVATCEEGKPHVRPFGAVCLFEGKLYLITGNQKKVYHQMKNNENVAICGMYKNTWMRIEGTVKEDLRREARVAMLEENKESLGAMYHADDGVMTVFYFEHGTATIDSFTEPSRVIEF
ncbi:pyridoxamine 5'-phosphate oxidase family protein [Anaerotignum lactatifermentans]|uniref:Pyridoxamine 5'-phosphate oxidase family protein n=1 Tax=Anaerotignum lactatifermentans TaxID=160404 RepID=A0ABS2G9W9_9FIRM|nr:pyridoxamine 5'-phosphate oxidase family protein [Anaerotignum lactatifermentans]MBM6830380.1 pyridoxamine 5'-phosphate oxidase family protein [Anaerotignum lactatifermentans]MBM6878286.1 pyridoxamine 5'-phosphate oxidase family protein [Anaerotignum lactatifermentans]MBM6951366.1 pyridoxamine 5'-phosphate oxidase family protein [Anaerotignum lactatifermentans]